jgi:hypothetical protein
VKRLSIRQRIKRLWIGRDLYDFAVMSVRAAEGPDRYAEISRQADLEVERIVSGRCDYRCPDEQDEPTTPPGERP